MRISLQRILCIATAAVVVLCLPACTQSHTENTVPTVVVPETQEMTETTVPGDPETIATEQVLDNMIIKTHYMDLLIPRVYMEGVKHSEVLQDKVAMEIFTLISGETQIELFRLYFGDEARGTLAGYLDVEGVLVPVTFEVTEYDGVFPNEQIKEHYFQVMNGFNAVLDCVYGNKAFSETKNNDLVGSDDANMRYWTVELPENISWEEIVGDTLYRVNFYGVLHNERILLYSIGFGEMDADYSIGTFLVDGEERIINVRISELPVTDEWTDEEISTGYRMLETVNDVIDAIMSSENFSEQMPE